PDHVALAGDRPGVVAADLGVLGHAVVGEAPPPRIEHAQAARLGGDPQPVARVHVQGLDRVARQRLRIARFVAPDAEADAVVARQAVGGSDPDVAGLVAHDRVDAGGGQAVGDAERAQARHLGHARGGQPDPQRQHSRQQPTDPPHPAPPLLDGSHPLPDPRNPCPASQARPPRVTAIHVSRPRIADMTVRTAHRRALPALLLAIAFAPALGAAEAELAGYRLDPVHTRVLFGLDHAGYTTALGTVSGSSGAIAFAPGDWSRARVRVSVPLQRVDF